MGNVKVNRIFGMAVIDLQTVLRRREGKLLDPLVFRAFFDMHVRKSLRFYRNQNLDSIAKIDSYVLKNICQ